MVPKNTSKFIISLHQKKYRQRNRAFLVEGAKSVTELLRSDFRVQLLLATPEFLLEHAQIIPKTCPVQEVSEQELVRLGTFESNNAALAIAEMRPSRLPELPENELLIALDEVRDPGNLGTIVRIADWYGIRHLICSSGCADFYNPKVISASMGSFCRVEAHYTDLPAYLTQQKTSRRIYAAALGEDNVYQARLQRSGILVMGNEASGISDEVLKLAHQRLTIPRFGGAESLNVAIATAILCDHFHRNI
jgi:TrmH family RNA methyltransferase